MMMLWIVGCSKHGINPALLDAVKHSIYRLNSLATTWNGNMLEGELSPEMASICDPSPKDDFFQGVDFVARAPRLGMADLSATRAPKHIVLVTTGYKIRQAHSDAIDIIDGESLILPYYDMNMKSDVDYSTIKEKVESFIYNGKDSQFTAWPHTEEKQIEAWESLHRVARESTCTTSCASCTYWGPMTKVDTRMRTNKSGTDIGGPARGAFSILWTSVMRELLENPPSLRSSKRKRE